MAQPLCVGLLAVAAVGLCLLALQLMSLARHLRAPPRCPHTRPGISILKPLCGLDDELETNLASFLSLPYPEYEVLLGVRDRRDPAYDIARRIAGEHPGRVRLLLQRGEPGANPKVNQLLTLAQAARHPILVISDSNIRVEPSYLDEVALALEDPDVGLVTHAITGVGAGRMGSLLDNLHLGSHVGPGVIASKRLVHKDIVVGKSLGLRRKELAAIGGFDSVKDLLAEDYAIGRRVRAIGKRCALAPRPVTHYSRDRSVGDFYSRYQRWAVLHRQAIGTATYLCEAVLNPLLFALAALVLHPSTSVLAACVGVAAAKATLDVASWSLSAQTKPSVRALAAVPLKDLLLGAAWLQGLFTNRVYWRGRRIEVLAGTRVERRRHVRGQLDPQPIRA